MATWQHGTIATMQQCNNVKQRIFRAAKNMFTSKGKKMKGFPPTDND